MTLGLRRSILLLLAALGGGLFGLGCDQVSPVEEKDPPTVSQLTVTPDTVDAATLEPLSGRDSLVQDTVGVSIRATDPDGDVARVVFTIEPAFDPRGTLAGPLRLASDDRYVGGAILTVPRFRETTYTVRAYAVDGDSLASNQSVGRLQVVPDS